MAEMAKTEFKEKSYEKWFGHELAQHTNVTFSPDQCDEAFFGFDEAFFLPIPMMRRLLPYRRLRRWQRLIGVSNDEFEKIVGKVSEVLPDFSFNLFVQYKRPEYLTTRGAKQWSSWGKAYYRYDVTPHQQEALEAVENLSGGRAATVYASPAFRKMTAATQHVKNREIVTNSNIASAGKLKGHGCYTYVSAGHMGKGHSEEEDIESTSIESLLLGMEGLEGLPLNHHLKLAAKLILTALSENERGKLTFEEMKSAISGDNLPEGSIIDAMATIEAFSDSFGVSYYALG